MVWAHAKSTSVQSLHQIAAQSRHLQLSFHHPHQTSRWWDDMHFVELNELYKNMYLEKLTRITNAWNDMVPNSTKYSPQTSDLTALCQLCPQWYMLSGCRSVNFQYIVEDRPTPWCRFGPIILIRCFRKKWFEAVTPPLSCVSASIYMEGAYWWLAAQPMHSDRLYGITAHMGRLLGEKDADDKVR